MPFVSAVSFCIYSTQNVSKRSESSRLESVSSVQIVERGLMIKGVIPFHCFNAGRNERSSNASRISDSIKITAYVWQSDSMRSFWLSLVCVGCSNFVYRAPSLRRLFWNGNYNLSSFKSPAVSYHFLQACDSTLPNALLSSVHISACAATACCHEYNDLRRTVRKDDYYQKQNGRAQQ